MIFGLFALFAANLILRLNDFVPGFAGFPIAEITIPILFVMWLLFEKKDFSSAADLLILMFYSVMVGGFALGVWPAGALGVARGYLPWVLLYFLTVNLVNTTKRMDVMMTVLYVASFVLVLHSWQQVRNWDGFDDKTGYGFSGATVQGGRIRYVGVMNDPNDLALFFSMMLPIGLQLATNGMRGLTKLFGYLLSVPMLFGVFLSNSRGGMLACGAVAAMYTWRRWGALKAGILCSILVAGALAFGPSRVREQNESDEISTQGRIEAWHRGIELLKQHPVVGCGTNEFTRYHYLTAHNSFVLCFAENGMAGFFCWMGIAFYCLYGLNEVRKRSIPGSPQYRQAIAMSDSLVAFYVGGFFLSRTYFILLPVFWGLAISTYKLARDEFDELAPPESDLAEQSPEPDVGADDQARDAKDHSPIPDLNSWSLVRFAPWIFGICLGMIVLVEFVVRVKR